MPHDLPVLAGAGLRLVGVDDEVVRPAVRLLGHERPFQPGREAGAAAPAQARLLHLVDDPVAALVEEELGAVPGARACAPPPGPAMQAVEVGEDAVAVGEHVDFSGFGLSPTAALGTPAGRELRGLRRSSHRARHGLGSEPRFWSTQRGSAAHAASVDSGTTPRPLHVLELGVDAPDELRSSGLSGAARGTYRPRICSSRRPARAARRRRRRPRGSPGRLGSTGASARPDASDGLGPLGALGASALPVAPSIGRRRRRSRLRRRDWAAPEAPAALAARRPRLPASGRLSGLPPRSASSSAPTSEPSKSDGSCSVFTAPAARRRRGPAADRA